MVRFKNRYILCELVMESDRLVYPIEQKDIYFAVKQAIERCHGDYGAGVTQGGLSVKYLNTYTKTVLIRVRRDHHKLLWSALPFIKSIGKQQVFLHSLHIGGTIRSCQKFLTKYGRQQLVVLLQKCRTQEERKAVQKSLLNIKLSIKRQSKNGADEDDDFSD
ncbi:ribonuclease P/MRP protein subunit POP5-like [Glandiceps talaboti]